MATQEERVRRFVSVLNAVVAETGLTLVGVSASILSFRLVEAGRVISPHHLGPTVDALHYQSEDAAFLTGAEDRARKDPEWAKTVWAGGQRRDGNDPLPIGQTGVRPICTHPNVEYYYHGNESDERVVRCLDCRTLRFDRFDVRARRWEET